MTENDEKGLYLRIDTRYNRFCIHKSVLKSIGNPEFIQLCFHPKCRELMILSALMDETKAIRVHYCKDRSFFVYSKALIDGIRIISGSLQKQRSYLLKGKLIDSIPAISFSVGDADAAIDENERILMDETDI